MGEQLGIAVSDNQGASWTVRHHCVASLDVEPHLHDVAFSGPTHGWAVGERGAIWASSDAGLNWGLQASGVASTLRGVHFTDPQHGWVVGHAGTALSTSDGGNTWTPRTAPSSDDLHDVHFASVSVGWVVTSGREMLHTTDGGLTWNVVASASGGELQAFAENAAGHVWAVGDNVVVATTDGVTWSPKPNLDFGAWRDIDFDGNGHGVVVGSASGGRHLHTADAGATWNEATTLGWANAVALGSAGDAVAANNDLETSDDGGVTWQQTGAVAPEVRSIDTDPYDTALGGISFVDADHGWVIARDVVWRTVDGGATWTSHPLPSGVSGRAIHFLDTATGFVAGEYGAIFKTSDAGNTWTAMTAFSTGVTLVAIDFPTPQVGYAAGSDGAAFKTTDGGDTWSTVTLGDATSVDNVAFASATHGYVGAFHTQDGGSSWSPAALTAQDFDGALRGWGVTHEVEDPWSHRGKLWVTVDGGSQWTEASTWLEPNDDYPRNIVAGRFLTPTDGWWAQRMGKYNWLLNRVDATGARSMPIRVPGSDGQMFHGDHDEGGMAYLAGQLLHHTGWGRPAVIAGPTAW